MNSAQLAAVLRTSPTRVARNATIGGVAALTAIGLLLVVRRLAGALSADLGVMPLAATLLVAATIVLGGRALWRQVGIAAPTQLEHAYAWAGTVAILLLCVGCAWPSGASLAWLLALPLFAGDHFSRVAFLAAPTAASPFPSRQLPTPLPPSSLAQTPAEFDEPFAGEPDATSADQVLQQLTRTRDAAGVESLRGTLHARLAIGQRHATLHVGFCPPLERLPVIDVEVADGPDASVKVVQAFAHGAQFELRLSEPAEEPCEVAIEFVATPTDADAATLR